jgi:hypothetical protein
VFCRVASSSSPGCTIVRVEAKSMALCSCPALELVGSVCGGARDITCVDGSLGQTKFLQRIATRRWGSV